MKKNKLFLISFICVGLIACKAPLNSEEDGVNPWCQLSPDSVGCKEVTSNPVPETDVLGCMEELANNYDEKVDKEDGSCEFEACMNEEGKNYSDYDQVRSDYRRYSLKHKDAKDIISNDNLCGEIKTGGGGSTLDGCTGNNADICYGGYDADLNPKELPVKVVFLELAGQTIPNQQAFAQDMVNVANNGLNYQGHQLIKMADPVIMSDVRPSIAILNDSRQMIYRYGDEDYYVIIIVKNYLSDVPGQAVGYSPGLRIDYKIKDSIVVMDYDYIKDHQYGPTVVIHEIFHGLGAPHTTHQNGSEANVFQHGMHTYRDLKYGTFRNSRWYGQYVLRNRQMNLDFSIHIDPKFSYRGVTRVQGVDWDTRTMMYAMTSSYQLFLDNSSGEGFNGAYSNILSVYYNSFME